MMAIASLRFHTEIGGVLPWPYSHVLEGMLYRPRMVARAVLPLDGVLSMWGRCCLDRRRDVRVNAWWARL